MKTCFGKPRTQTKTKTRRSILILKPCMCTNFYRGMFITTFTIIMSYLPPFCTFSRKLCEDNRLFRMLLFMLLAAGLYEERIRRHSATRLCICTLAASHLCCYLIILICILCVGLILLKRERKNELKLMFTRIVGQYFRTSRMINYKLYKK